MFHFLFFSLFTESLILANQTCATIHLFTVGKNAFYVAKSSLSITRHCKIVANRRLRAEQSSRSSPPLVSKLLLSQP